jgi:hypothetical protein
MSTSLQRFQQLSVHPNFVKALLLDIATSLDKSSGAGANATNDNTLRRIGELLATRQAA